MAGHIVVVYLDDIVVDSGRKEEHIVHMRQCFYILRQRWNFLNDTETVLGLSKFSYLGFTTADCTVYNDRNKAKAVLKLPRPSGVLSLRSVLGLLSCSRNFNRGFGTLAAPPCELITKDKPFTWIPPCKTNMEVLKQAICPASTLALIDPYRRDFELTTDANGVALGDLMEQSGRLVALESDRLSALVFVQKN